jgi:hypothetical protein
MLQWHARGPTCHGPRRAEVRTVAGAVEAWLRDGADDVHAAALMRANRRHRVQPAAVAPNDEPIAGGDKRAHRHAGGLPDGRRARTDGRRACIDTTGVRLRVSICAPASPAAAPSGRVSSRHTARAARRTGISTASAPRSPPLAPASATSSPAPRVELSAAPCTATSSPAPRVELSAAPCTAHSTLAAPSSVCIPGRINRFRGGTAGGECRRDRIRGRAPKQRSAIDAARTRLATLGHRGSLWCASGRRAVQGTSTLIRARRGRCLKDRVADRRLRLAPHVLLANCSEIAAARLRAASATRCLGHHRRIRLATARRLLRGPTLCARRCDPGGPPLIFPRMT